MVKSGEGTGDAAAPMVVALDNQEPTPERDRAIAVAEADQAVYALGRKLQKEKDTIAGLEAALKDAIAARKELD